METYPVDLEASQIVRLRGTLQLNVTATHSYVVEALEKADLDQIGEEGEELNDILAIGMLEVSPPAGKNGWVLRIRVEDRIGPRLPEDEDASEGEEELDLQTFEAISSRLSEGQPRPLPRLQAKARFSRVFNDMLRNEHRG
jgi:hypothetical protein